MVIIVITKKTIVILSLDAPQCCCIAVAKNLFYVNLGVEMLKADVKYVVLRDFNGHVGKKDDVTKKCTKGFDVAKNTDNKKVLKFADKFGLKIAYTWFK